jgi:hypothetical protein
MKLRFLTLVLAGCSVLSGHYVRMATPPPHHAIVVHPRAPGRGYYWVGGYYHPIRGRWDWHPGYWVRPPYAHAFWVAPRYYSGRWYPGYWRR